ncbi:MAG TPA: VIT domain-containing protein [Longimicrobium sp.]|nr:VIT domain-containing protein [Longimicrobium sp.]
MRALSLLALLCLLSAAPAAGQGIVVPIRCVGACPAASIPSGSLAIDSVQVWANLERGEAVTYVNNVIRNAGPVAVDGAFFFPVPRGAVVDRVTLYEGQELKVYGEWSGPEESRWILEGLARERPDARLAAYAGVEVVHVRVPSVPAGGTQDLQVSYRVPLRPEGGAIAYRYPLSVGAAAGPHPHLRLGLTVKTEAGFENLRSPTHEVDVQLGTESVPCPREMRCGFRGAPSQRVRVVRLKDAASARSRDFEFVYTPTPPGAANAASRP